MTTDAPRVQGDKVMTFDMVRFWREIAISLTDEMVVRGNRIEELVKVAPPFDDIEYVIARYTFQIERGQDERLDRVNAWLDKVKPLEPLNDEAVTE